MMTSRVVVCLLIINLTIGGALGHASVDELLRNVQSTFSHITTPSLPEATVGGLCYTHQGNKGYCDIVSSCPAQFRVLHRLKNAAIYNYFEKNICRKEDSTVYFCCPENIYIPPAVFSTNDNNKKVLLDPRPIVSGGESPNLDEEIITTDKSLSTRSHNQEPAVVRSPLLPTDDECGTYSLSTRIIGGKPSKFGRFPWLAILGTYSNLRIFSLKCGGAVISTRYILSSNCFEDFRNPTHVRLGDYDFLSKYDGAKPNDYHIINVIKHQFVKYTHENDISLIRVDRTIIFNDYLKPACLPFNLMDEDFVGETVTLAGRGYVKSYREPVVIPYEADFTVVSLQECEDSHNNTDNSVTEKNICLDASAAVPCKGDTGSPVNYVDKTTSKWVIIGLQSLDSDCKLGTEPAITTKIAPYLSWIMDNMEE